MKFLDVIKKTNTNISKTCSTTVNEIMKKPLLSVVSLNSHFSMLVSYILRLIFWSFFAKMLLLNSFSPNLIISQFKSL